MNQEIQHPRVVRIHIDKQLYESPTPTTGSALYLLSDDGNDVCKTANVPLRQKSFRGVAMDLRGLDKKH